MVISASHGRNVKPYQKNKANRSGSMTQVVELLPSSMSPNASTKKTEEFDHEKVIGQS